MTSQLERLEKILGGKLERQDARMIPGTVAVDGTELAYFADDGKNKFRKQLRNIMEFTNPPNAKYGGVNERGCKITLPSGQLFHAIGYHGDLDGWRMDIEAGAQALHLLLGRIKGDNFAVSDGRLYPLSECTIEFD
ncbi:hypothetical protein [Pandoraea sp. ISTKB]|uniref:hypothetical protein n=1 Tax=Pandoraea sp. ISTKB TaxID=1586708 RepID=UPI000846F1B2|nr:hypothetical protein [Pandoraea sp. ISTKB]ODP30902.1 hypothetical protein A9762_27635 [Pandoraea sp. ISTKB]